MFGFRLCLALKEKHPDYLLPSLTSRQLAEWQAFFNLHPFGQDTDWGMLAQMLAVIINRHRKPGMEVDPKDLMPGKRRKQSVEEIKFGLRSAIDRALSGNR
jgi:hypothetical protein